MYSYQSLKKEPTAHFKKTEQNIVEIPVSPCLPGRTLNLMPGFHAFP